MPISPQTIIQTQPFSDYIDNVLRRGLGVHGMLDVTSYAAVGTPTDPNPYFAAGVPDYDEQFWITSEVGHLYKVTDGSIVDVGDMGNSSSGGNTQHAAYGGRANKYGSKAGGFFDGEHDFYSVNLAAPSVALSHQILDDFNLLPAGDVVPYQNTQWIDVSGNRWFVAYDRALSSGQFEITLQVKQVDNVGLVSTVDMVFKSLQSSATTVGDTIQSSTHDPDDTNARGTNHHFEACSIFGGVEFGAGDDLGYFFNLHRGIECLVHHPTPGSDFTITEARGMAYFHPHLYTTNGATVYYANVTGAVFDAVYGENVVVATSLGTFSDLVALGCDAYGWFYAREDTPDEVHYFAHGSSSELANESLGAAGSSLHNIWREVPVL